MKTPATLDDLLPVEMVFLAAIQRLGFGRVEYLQIQNGELVLDPWPTVVQAIKFTSNSHDHKSNEPNSTLRPQAAQFFSLVRQIGCGEICELQIRHGLPFTGEIKIAGGHRV